MVVADREANDDPQLTRNCSIANDGFDNFGATCGAGVGIFDDERDD